MYPVIRMTKELIAARKLPRLDLTGTHVSHHRCWPWDIDLWMELNNGRTLTLYDLGRIPLARRIGLIRVLAKKRWGMTMAGVSVRYRRRIRTFEKVEMRSRVTYWDNRFIYIEQSMWKQNGECANHALYRTAVTGPDGILNPQLVAEAMGASTEPLDCPEWVRLWIEAEAVRPWPPMMDPA